MVSLLDNHSDMDVELGEPEDMSRAGLVGTIQGALEMIKAKRRERALAKLAARRAAVRAKAKAKGGGKGNGGGEDGSSSSSDSASSVREA